MFVLREVILGTGDKDDDGLHISSLRIPRHRIANPTLFQSPIVDSIELPAYN